VGLVDLLTWPPLDKAHRCGVDVMQLCQLRACRSRGGQRRGIATIAGCQLVVMGVDTRVD
jgi:hypothetical protein